MKITIYRGTQEIGGTLIELKTQKSKILIDAGYPLFLNGNPINDNVATLPKDKLLELGVLPDIKGLYKWDNNDFDGVIISHAHIDHYGLLKYINTNIPIYLSAGTKKIIEISQLFKITDTFLMNSNTFMMYKDFEIGDFTIKSFLMDHSAFDAAAFEISVEGKTVIYTGDFRGHGRKFICLDRFIKNARKQSDILLTEGTMFGRLDEKVLTEIELEAAVFGEISRKNLPVLFQTSSQNIDRLVTFFKVAVKSDRLFILDVYTANILFELNKLGFNLPCPSKEYSNIKVFYPYRITQKLFNNIGQEYAKRFSPQYISMQNLNEMQNNIIMACRPSMMKDLEKCNLKNGLFVYSMWQGYRENDYQKRFENFLNINGFETKYIHTSGHAAISDIKRVIYELNPKKIIPIHTMFPKSFIDISNKIELLEDGKTINI